MKLVRTIFKSSSILLILLFICPDVLNATDEIEEQEALEGQFPFLVSVNFEKSGGHLCSGAIFNRHWVLTTARCVDKVEPNDVVITAGSIYTTNTEVVHRSDVIVPHTFFNPKTSLNDIALIKLKPPINFTAFVESIAVGRAPSESEVTLAGWCNVSTSTVSKVILSSQVTTMADSQCEQLIAAPLERGQLCVQEAEDGGFCTGDAGEVMLHEGMVVGMYSHKVINQGEKVFVFTKIFDYLGWVFEIINDCNC